MRISAGLVCVFSALAALSATPPALAQMSVTTIGATDAVSCYENARNDFSRDTDPCDKALADRTMSRSDQKKTLVNRGVIYNRGGEVGAAIDDFNEALDLDGALGEAYLNRGNSYYLMQRYGDALANKWLGYLSSSGVYGDTGGAWVDESAPVGTGRRGYIPRLRRLL